MHAQEKSVLEVTPAEAGQKLLQFLQRRLSLPPTLLHRWVRTGQIRRNGGRCKPFDHVDCGDKVRLPPFAFAMNDAAVQGHEALMGDAAARQQRHESVQEGIDAASTPRTTCNTQKRPSPPLLPLPPLAYADHCLLVFNKPAGLPVHPGTGHSDALTTRLAQHYADRPFLPTPAHRLDKDTSGLLLVASAYSTLRALQEAFRQRHMIKEYVAWVQGLWPHEKPLELRHHLAKTYVGSDEKMRVCDDAKEAACIAHCLRRAPDPRAPQGARSLMHIRLITGRTHQIRAQLAEVGHPLCGDFKYGAAGNTPLARHGKYTPPAPRTLYLHSLRIILPDVAELVQIPREFTALPPWQGRMALQELPPPLTVPAP